jgi:hypothetical protein
MHSTRRNTARRKKIKKQNNVIMKKKQLLWAKIMFVLVSYLVLASCTEDNYYKNSEEEPSAYWAKYTIHVDQSQWRWDPERGCYYYETNPTWMTEYIAKNGVVAAFIDKGNDLYYPLPYVAYYYQQNSPVNGYYFSETINCEFAPGYLCFNVTASDLFDNTNVNYLPESYFFQVRLVW